jgi:type I restriction enzyme R subunit
VTVHSSHSVHKEQVLQDHMIDQLVVREDYELRDPKTDYDRALAADKTLVLRFVQDTQPEEWSKLEAHYTASAEETFFTQLAKALKDRGLLDVLRQGIKIVPGIKLSLCFFLPASALEPKRVAEYQANILSVMKEVEYSQKHGGRLDVVLFVNGLPVVTMEAKNLLTGSTFKHAEKQYPA